MMLIEEAGSFSRLVFGLLYRICGSGRVRISTYQISARTTSHLTARMFPLTCAFSFCTCGDLLGRPLYMFGRKRALSAAAPTGADMFTSEIRRRISASFSISNCVRILA